MSLLGIDVGTAGCKAAVFSEEGKLLSFAGDEYDARHPRPGWAELDTREVWGEIAAAAQKAASRTASDPVRALSVSSLGEAVVPMGADREILGPSILNFDIRGAEYLQALAREPGEEELYRINGNPLGNAYTLPKLLWLRDRDLELFEKTRLFLPWGSFVGYMLGAEPRVDYSLANRTLLFDIDKAAWSARMTAIAGIDPARLPAAVPSGSAIGTIPTAIAREVGLPAGTIVVSGAHDQCAAALGAGVISEGTAMCSMGSYLCVAPVFHRRPDPSTMLRLRLNTEHHSVPGLFVSFLYNPSGLLVRWFRDTFARLDREKAILEAADIYDTLVREIPEGPSSVFVLPRFGHTGPPDFSSERNGVIAGLSLETSRGDILKGIMEGVLFHVRELVQSIGKTGVSIRELRAVGGGSKSKAWTQLCTDILGIPVTRPRVGEAGCLGAAIMAGVGCGAFKDFGEGVSAMVTPGDSFEPEPSRRNLYDERFEGFKSLWPMMRGWFDAGSNA